MTYASQASIDMTLTRSEREAPFALGDVDGGTLPKPWRSPIIWSSPTDWAEIDPQTGDIIATGSIPDHSDREELRP